MYVPGQLEDTERVLLDIGTGYYVEKVREPTLDSNRLLQPTVL